MNDESLDPKRQTMIAALYGELSTEEQARFEVLLSEDAALRAEWEELRETRALLETVTANEPAHTPEFVFIDRAQKESKPKRRFAWLPAFSQRGVSRVPSSAKTRRRKRASPHK